MAKVLIDTGPSRRGWHLDRLADVVLTGALSPDLLRRDLELLIGELLRDPLS
jgi:hypothetical protein